MTTQLHQIITSLAAGLDTTPTGLYEALITAAYIASAQIAAFFIVVIVISFVWVKAFKKYTKPKYKGDLTSAVLFVTCVPLSIAFLGSFVLLFVAIGWLINPDSYLLALLQGNGILFG